MTNRKFKGLSLDGIFRMAVFTIMKQKCNNSNRYAPSISFLHRWERTLGKKRQWAMFMETFHVQICILHMHIFFSIEPVLSRSAICLPLQMISLLPVTPQCICRAIRLSIPTSLHNCSLLYRQCWRYWKGGTESKPVACCSPVCMSHFSMHLLHVLNFLTNEILTVVNSSLHSGKSAVVKPLQKKLNLDIAIIIHNQAISNHSFASGRLSINNWLITYWMVNHLPDDFQSGICANHSTKTAAQRPKS